MAPDARWSIPVRYPLGNPRLAAACGRRVVLGGGLGAGAATMRRPRRGCGQDDGLRQRRPGCAAV